MDKIIIDPDMVTAILEEVRYFAQEHVVGTKHVNSSVHEVHMVFKRLYELHMSGDYETEYIELKSP